MSAILDIALNLITKGITREVTLRGTIDNYARSLPLMNIHKLTIHSKSNTVESALSLADQFFFALEEEYKNKRGPKYDLTIEIVNPTTGKIYATLTEARKATSNNNGVSNYD